MIQRLRSLQFVMPSYEADVAKSRGVLHWIATRIPGMRWWHLFGLALAITVFGMMLMLVGVLGEIGVRRVVGLQGGQFVVAMLVVVGLFLILGVHMARSFGVWWRAGFFNAELFVWTVGSVAGALMAVGTWMQLIAR